MVQKFLVEYILCFLINHEYKEKFLFTHSCENILAEICCVGNIKFLICLTTNTFMTMKMTHLLFIDCVGSPNSTTRKGGTIDMRTQQIKENTDRTQAVFCLRDFGDHVPRV